jgi:hypothetical protein
MFIEFLCCGQTKSPLSFYASAGLNSCCWLTQPHTPAVAMGVMVVMMVASQHERFKLRDGTLKVNSKDSMRKIRFYNAK